jgi:hypothetical protein
MVRLVGRGVERHVWSVSSQRQYTGLDVGAAGTALSCAET